MTHSSRRDFLKTSAIGVGAIACNQAIAQTSSVSKQAIEQAQSILAQKSIETTANWNDGLAHPIPFKNPFAQGKQRGLALGGGGTPLLSWYVGYALALKKAGVDLSTADVIVGTSAGSIFGAMLTSGHLWRLADELDIFADLPKLFSILVPAKQPNLSQIRSQKAALTGKDASPASIQYIGKTAMAASNPDGVDNHYKAIEKLLTSTAWPSEGMFTTAIDCFTGERVVVSKTSNVPINVACAASSSAPGGAGPTFVKNRLCMDGGICQTSTHSDVIVGVKKAIVISLGDGTVNEQNQGLRLSSLPDTVNQEIKMLVASGAQTKHIVAGLPPGISHVDNFLDPKWIAPYLKYGHERGLADASMMKAFW